MQHDNNATRIRRELLVKLARILLEGPPGEKLDRLVLELRPRQYKGRRLRCCFHSERAILKYRLMAMLGFCVEDETDELKPLSRYAQEARDRTVRDPRLLTVIDEACSACVQAAHVVTDACRGCMAQPCILNCPKEAIRSTGGRSFIDPEACVNCGRCQPLCPFHAIVRVPVPCEESCPVQAISRGESGKQVIDHDKCIACGRCMQACPFGAVVDPSELAEVLGHLQRGEPMAVLFAPALGGQFEASVARVSGALRLLGFSVVAEVAAGADEVARDEARELEERLEHGEPFMTSSCCPAYTALASQLPALAPRVSTTPTPLQATSRLVEARWPGIRKVFISPCLAKRREVLETRSADHVLTFEELGALLVARDIEVDRCPEVPADLQGSRSGRGFAAAGGVTGAVRAHLREEIPAERLCGLDKEGLRRLRAYAAGKGDARFLEVMSCDGGCLSGPCVMTPPKLAARRLAQP